jgi:FkbM family methyltransferase
MLTNDEKIIFSKIIPHLPANPVIFDVGAYKGQYTDYVKSRIPTADCYLFEANRELIDGLRGYNAFNCLLTDKVGKRPFYRCKDKADELSSAYKREVFKQVEYETDAVRATTVDAFSLANNITQIYFLKIDVEGAELDVLKGSKRMLSEKRILFAQVEYGGTYPDAGITFKQVIQYLDSLDYKVYELKGNDLSLMTVESFTEDYRFANFLITHLCI